MDLAGQFLNKDAPRVVIDRDLNLQALESEQVNQYQQLWMNGVITHETLLGILKKGEILPDVDIDAEIEGANQEKLQGMDIALAGENVVQPNPGQPESKNDDEGGNSQVKEEVVRRLQALAIEER